MSNANNMDTPTGRRGNSSRAPHPGVALPLQPKGKGKAVADKVDWRGDPSQSNSSGNVPQALVFGNAGGLTGPMRSMQLNGQARGFEPLQNSNPYMKNLLRDSQPDEAGPSNSDKPLIVHSNGAGNGKAVVVTQKEKSPIGTRPEGQISINTHFTTDVGHTFQGGHYVAMRNVKNKHDWSDGLARMLEDFGYHLESKLYDARLSEPSDLRKTVNVYLCFDDFRDSAACSDPTDIVKPHWTHDYVSHSLYASSVGVSCAGMKPAMHYDGQVLFIAQPSAPLTKEGLDAVEKGILDLAFTYGTVHAFTELTRGDVAQLQFRLEFHRITAAQRLLNEVNTMCPYEIGDFDVVAYPYGERPSQEPDNDEETATTSSITSHKPMISGPEDVNVSPTGRTAWSIDADGNAVMRKPTVVVPKLPNTQQEMIPMQVPIYDVAVRDHFRSAPQVGYNGFIDHSRQMTIYEPRVRAYHAHGWGTGPINNIHGRRAGHVVDPNEPQAVKLDRLANGQDIRTTIMLRNIPNQWNYRDLKRRLDEIVKDKYDFSYLRIDFENNTNVGYGFINLIGAEYVGPFYHALVGAEWWPGHHPRKLGQVSYATIQGIDCLIEKFRNSAIMSEFPDYRPKLWYLPSDAPNPGLIGTEKPFPSSNNQTKTQRSHDNAGTIGLYAPRSAQRGGDRSRRSNYDRGTQHQLQEDAYYASPSYDNYTAVPRAPIAPPPAQFAGNPYGYASYQFPPQYGYGPPPYYPPMHYAGPSYGHPGYPMPHPQQFADPFHGGMPASGLRTINQGRVAGRPQSGGVAPNHIPRAFSAVPEQVAANDGFSGGVATNEETEITR